MMNSDEMNMSSPIKLSLELDHLSPTDCVFIFDGEEIKAHKLILTCSSPVFEKMFYGKMASNRIIITDISLEDFSQMLTFIYTNTVRIKSVLQAWSLFYVAHKYLLDHFADACVNYIQHNLNINNLVLNYEYAEMYGNEKLQTICLKDIADYIRGIFLIKICDYHMKPTSLVKILKQKTLNISNNELVVGVINWAVIECDIKNINISPENVISLLNSVSILQCLTQLDFSVNCNSDLLVVECCRLIKNFKNPTIPYKNYLKKHWCIFCKCRQTYKIAGRIEMRERDAVTSNLSVNKNSLLYGLVVVTEDKQATDKNEYNGIIRIQISEINNPESLVDTTFKQTFLYETSVYIPLSSVLFLESGKIYSLKVGYKNLENLTDLGINKSSILCDYMSNKLIDDRRNIVFSFDELYGSVIRGISYYPA